MTFPRVTRRSGAGKGIGYPVQNEWTSRSFTAARPETGRRTIYFTEPTPENNSVLAVAVMASTPGCFSRRSAEIA